MHAYDWLYSEYIIGIVELAERIPNVGLVGAYRLDENYENLDGLPYSDFMLSGREVCRKRLMGGPDLFSLLTSLLYRADLIRSRAKFYNEDNFHAETEIIRTGCQLPRMHS